MSCPVVASVYVCLCVCVFGLGWNSNHLILMFFPPYLVYSLLHLFCLGTMYMGGSPLFDMSTGIMTDRYTYLCKKFPNLPWLDNETTNEDTNSITETDSNPNNETMSPYPDCDIDVLDKFLYYITFFIKNYKTCKI